MSSHRVIVSGGTASLSWSVLGRIIAERDGMIVVEFEQPRRGWRRDLFHPNGVRVGDVGEAPVRFARPSGKEKRTKDRPAPTLGRMALAGG